MRQPPQREREPQDAMGALVRLYERQVVTLEQAQVAARLMTGDPNAVFPPPPPPAPPPKPEEVPAAPGASGNGDGSNSSSPATTPE